MKRFKLFSMILLLFVLSVNCAGCKQTGELPKYEFRGAWLHVVGNKTIATMDMQQIQQWFLHALDSLQMTGCNAVIFQVRPTADAFYKSDIEPWSRYLTGVQGKAPEPFWDPLQFMIEESHKRGMELHAWCNPYRVTLEESDTLCADHLYFKNPEIFVKHGKQLYFNPCEPASRAHTVKVISADHLSRELIFLKLNIRFEGSLATLLFLISTEEPMLPIELLLISEPDSKLSSLS